MDGEREREMDPHNILSTPHLSSQEATAETVAAAAAASYSKENSGPPGVPPLVLACQEAGRQDACSHEDWQDVRLKSEN